MGGNQSKNEEQEEIEINESVLNESQNIFFVLSRIRHQSRNDIFLSFRRLYKRSDPDYYDHKKCYALKVIEMNDNFKDEDFEREQNVLELLKDFPQFIKYEKTIKIKVGSKDYILIPMKYYYQTDVYSYMTRRGFTYNEDFVCLIAYKTLKILKILKERKIVHNDIKLHNFIIESEKPFKLILTDFEGAQFLSNDEKSDIFAGTFIFASPEVLRGELHSFSADIWSLGVNIFYILFGTFPFDILPSDSKERMHEKMMNNELLKLNDFISDQAFECVKKILVFDPDERITVEDALNLDWFNNMEDDDTYVLNDMIANNNVDDDRITVT